MRISIIPASEICAGELARQTLVRYAGHMHDLATKIRLLRQSLGVNQTDFGERLGVTQGTVSRWEKGSMPESEALTALAELMGTDVRALLNADFSAAPQLQQKLFIKGAVAAGVWKEAVQWPEDEWMEYIGGAHIEVSNDLRFGLVVEGESMNDIYPPGTILDCVSTIGNGIQPESGQRVIVIRRRFDGECEATVKELVVDREGKHWLVPRSNNPAFQNPIALYDDADVEETVITAIVRGSYRPE